MELIEALKTRKRMCDYMTKHCLSCNDCPLGALEDDWCFLDLDPSSAEKYENILAQWNREHPVKTLADYFFECLPNASKNSTGVPQACCKTVGLATDDICGEMEDCTACWRREYQESHD